MKGGQSTLRLKIGPRLLGGKLGRGPHIGVGMIAEKEKRRREYVLRYHKPGQPLDCRRSNNKKKNEEPKGGKRRG